MLRNSTGWKLAGTTSFRKASSQLLKGSGSGEKGYGTNLQNPSPDVLRIHVADPGKILGQRDQAGAEALIVAYLAPDGKFRSLFKNGIKSHVYVATKIFEKHWICEGHPADFFLNIPINELRNQAQWKPYLNYVKKTGAPSLGEGELYKLMLKLKDRQLENPVLDLVIAFRRRIKSSGMLKIIPWDRNFLHGPKKHPVYMELKQS